ERPRAQCIAAYAIELGAVARELRGARDAQPLAETAEHELAIGIGKRDARRALVLADLYRRRIALDGIDERRNADRVQQQRTTAAQRNDVDIGVDRFAAAMVGIDRGPAARTANRNAVGHERLDSRAPA